MKIQYILGRIAKKFSVIFYRLLGIDPICRARIIKRNDLKKLGTDYGGWVVPTNLLSKESICYCVGCGEDISFDLGLINEFDCDVFAFDPTPRAIKHVKSVAGDNIKYHFSDFGLWDKEDTLKFFVPKNENHVSHSALNLQDTIEYIVLKVKNIAKIMEDNGHKHLDLLKIDIEGAEYRVIQSITKGGIDIKTLCVEFDEYFHPLDKDFKKRIRESVNSLIASGYAMVFSQGNGNYTFVKN